MTLLSVILTISLIFALLLLLLPLAKKFEENKKTIVMIGLFVPIFSLTGYFYLGTPGFADIAVQNPKAQQTTLVDKLKEKLQKNPEDFNGWVLLGRSYMVTEDYLGAVQAFEQALKLKPDHVKVMVSLADALSVSQQGSMAGRPYDLLQQAYELSPNDTMTLWLLGMAEKQRKNNKQAAVYWQKLYPLIPETSEDKNTIRLLLASIGERPLQADSSTQAKTETITTEKLNSDVLPDISPDTLENADFVIDKTIIELMPKATLFVYAKATDGMPMPIAAKKVFMSEMPSEIELNAEHEIMPNRKLADFEELVIGYRIEQENMLNQNLNENALKKEKTISHNHSAKIIIKMLYK